MEPGNRPAALRSVASLSVLDRALDNSYPAEVREHIGLLTVARTAANACFRFTPAFLATIAAGKGVTLDRIGVALAISELSGLASPLTGRVAERLHRRTAMWVGLAGVGAGTLLASAGGPLAVFTVALVVIAQSKMMFDLGLAAWVSDHVPFARRGRVIGLTETSWAFGLLLGVTAMGLVTAATSWQLGYAVGAVAVVALAAGVARAVPDDAHPPTAHAPRATMPGRVSRHGWTVIAGVFCLMSASQALFVTLSGWLRDVFELTDSSIAAVSFCIGFGELFASLSAARVADRWGKERAVAVGAGAMVPAALLVALTHDRLLPALPLLVVAIVAFEFAIVSAIPLGTELVPGAPARGLALMLAAGTLGRATMSIVATRVYVSHGMEWAAALSATLAAAMVLAMWIALADRRHAAAT